MIHNDLTDSEWRIVKEILLAKEAGKRRRGQHGFWAKPNRKFVDGIFWKLRTGGEWREIPDRYGKWNSIYQCYSRWDRSGVWSKLATALPGRFPEGPIKIEPQRKSREPPPVSQCHSDT